MDLRPQHPRPRSQLDAGRNPQPQLSRRRPVPARLAALAALLLVGCAAPVPVEPSLDLAPASFADLPGWAADSQAEAVPALQRSCETLMKLPPMRRLGPDGQAGVAGDWQTICAAAGALPASDQAAARAFFERYFRPYRASDRGDAEGLFTGYYEPELRGARERSARFPVPLYRRPPELVEVDLGAFRDALRGERIAGHVVSGRLVPYHERRAIQTGALAGRGLELAWVDDPVDAFFLQIQGSGRVTMEDGSVLRVGYAAANGYAYTSIGRVLIERGAVPRENMSMQAIRDWLAANPAEAGKVMAENASYVFFRPLEGDGPVGAQGVALTPGRSLAVDRRFVAYGLPIWLDTVDPLDPDKPLRRLVIAQDTGGAIRGPVRGDLFWGHGTDARARAGTMKGTGGYWLLLPRNTRVAAR